MPLQAFTVDCYYLNMNAYQVFMLIKLFSEPVSSRWRCIIDEEKLANRIKMDY